MDMVRLDNLVKRYDNGKRTINDVNLGVETGSHVLITGTEGSGKTTLLKLIAGIEAPSAGNIYIDGKAVHEMNADTAAAFRNRTIGIVSRHPGFMNTLTMIENISLPLTVRKISGKERKQSVIEHMDTLGIRHLIYAYPFQLSIMELQLTALARALVMQPKILLLDNMESDLTVKQSKKIKDLICTAGESNELTIIRFTDRENDDWQYDGYFRLECGRIWEC